MDLLCNPLGDLGCLYTLCNSISTSDLRGLGPDDALIYPAASLTCEINYWKPLGYTKQLPPVCPKSQLNRTIHITSGLFSGIPNPEKISSNPNYKISSFTFMAAYLKMFPKATHIPIHTHTPLMLHWCWACTAVWCWTGIGKIQD